ncbi:MAG TPA: hypothetical protein VFS67_16345 [Polyangiaceae bacterium]|nr:hypothetical protein [Polyangiaceae bacterium]
MQHAPAAASERAAFVRLPASLCVAIALLCACNTERARGDALAAPQPTAAPLAAPEQSTEALAAQPEALPAEPQTFAPGANDEFDPAALADVKQALSAVEENAFASLVNGDKRVLPKSCREWRSFRARGFAPKTALAEQLDGGALVRCGTYEFLARAKPSRRSHVRKALQGAGPDDLPAVVASTTSKLALRARNLAVAKGLTLGAFLPGARTGRSELRGRVLIDEPASATSVIVNAEAWGDVNSDEVEDLLLSVLNSSDDLSYFDLRLIEVTRAAPDAPLTVLAVSE